MDAEPRGHTIDGTPWQEPRPPHLPDRLTSASPWVLPFVLVVIYQLWLLWVGQPRAGELDLYIEYWVGSRYGWTGLLGSLIGLALFIRHPDARVTLPQVTSGAFLLLLSHVLLLLETTLDPFFIALAPPGDELSFFSPVKQAYSIITSLIGILGIAFIASGLSAARRYEGRPVRKLAAVLTIAAVASLGLSIAGLTTIEFEVSTALVAAVISSLLVNFLGLLAVAYLLLVTLTSWLGQEEPRVGWGLAALGSGLMLLNGLLTSVVGLLPVSQDVLLTVVGSMADAGLVGWVLLIVAFALGLPSTVSVPTDDPLATMQPGSEAG